MVKATKKYSSQKGEKMHENWFFGYIVAEINNVYGESKPRSNLILLNESVIYIVMH